MVRVCGEALDQLGGCDDIRQGIVSAYGDQLVVGELADDGGGLVALLLLRQLVAIQGDDALTLRPSRVSSSNSTPSLKLMAEVLKVEVVVRV